MRPLSSPVCSPAPLRSSRVVLALAAWLAAASIIGALGLLGRLRPPGPQLILLGLTVALLASAHLARPLRAWVTQVDLRVLVGVHVGRLLAGATFLVLVGRGALPAAFLQAGIGDATVALLAVALIALVAPTRPGSRRLYLAWNVIGLADILLVLATGVRLGLRTPEAMAAFGHLPLVLLPLFLVPLVLATHVWLFGRLRTATDSAPAASSGDRAPAV
jgi:hypothetical protein